MTQPPRLVFLFPTWEVSGVSTVQLLLAEGLAKRGLCCDLIGTDLNQDQPPDGFIPSGVRYHQLVPKPLARTIFGLRRPALARARKIIDRKLRQYVAGDDPIVLVPGFDLGWLAWDGGLPENVSLLGIVHADDPWWYDAAKRMSCHTKHLVAVSRRLQDELSKMLNPWPGSVECIPNGVSCTDSPPQRSAIGARPLHLLYAGRIVERQKRVSRIPKLLKALEEKGISFTMEIAGEGAQEEWLREACRPWVSNSTVKFLGRLAPWDVRAACRRADVFVLLSDYEGLPMGLLEAMAEGCIPLVSRGLSGVEEVVQDGVSGICVSSDDPEGQASVLRDVCADHRIMSSLGQKAGETIREQGYSTDPMVTSYLRLLSQVWFRRAESDTTSRSQSQSSERA